MKQEDAVKAIYQTWMAAWPGLSGAVPFVFDDDIIDETTSYARVRVVDKLSEQWTLGPPGTRKWLRTSEIAVLLKFPANQGRKPGDQLVGFVRTIFEGVRIGVTNSEQGITTYAASSSPGPLDGQYAQMMVRVPFDYYEQR